MKTATSPLVRAATLDDLATLPGQLADWYATGPAAAVVLDEEKPPVFMAGTIPWGYVPNASAWFVRREATPDISPFWLTRMVRAYLRGWQANFGWQRIDTTVLAGWRPGLVFARRCGFVYEGTMQRWGFDGNAYDLLRWGG